MVRSPERIDFDSASAVLTALEQELRAAPSPAIDLSSLATFDSAALAVLLELRRRLADGDAARFGARHPPPALRALAEVYGIAALLFEPLPAGPGTAASSS